MKKHFRILIFALPFLLASPAFSQSKELVRAIMTNPWVAKYKKLKRDLENKVAYLKNMDGLPEDKLNAMKKSYTQTQMRLDLWINHLTETVAGGNSDSRERLAQGDLDDNLKEELRDIFSFYSNDFIFRFEETTGQNPAYVFDTESSEKNGNSLNAQELLTEKTDKEALMSRIKNSLEPLSWAAIY